MFDCAGIPVPGMARLFPEVSVRLESLRQKDRVLPLLID